MAFFLGVSDGCRGSFLTTEAARPIRK